jgi:hypothetical protein
MECTMEHAAGVKKTEFTFSLFSQKVEEKLDSELLSLVKSLLNEERFALLDAVKSDMVSPLVGRTSDMIRSS